MPEQVRHDEGVSVVLLMVAVFLATQPVDCSAALTQQDMNRCATEAARASEADMNRVAALVMRQLQEQHGGGENGAAATRFRNAQRTWLAFREAQCVLAGVEALGGTLEPVIVSGCLRDMTERRASELMMMIR